MSSFDRETWLHRVRSRKDTSRVDRDEVAVDGLDRIINWCTARAITVEFRKISDGTYYGDEKKIVISSSAAPETQLWLILHECGHHLFTLPSYQRTPRIGTITYCVNELAEEFAAWDSARKVAIELGITLDAKFERFRLRCLYQYVDWAAKRGKGYNSD